MPECSLIRLLSLLEHELQRDAASYNSKVAEAVGLLYINISSIGAVAVTRGATGILLEREDGSCAWGAPRELRFGGFGFGLEAGFENTEAVFCFYSKHALNTFLQRTTRGKLWSFKGSFTFGPFGYTREMVIRKKKKTCKERAMSTVYCHSSGINAGLSFMLSGLELSESPEPRLCQRDINDFACKLETLR